MSDDNWEIDRIEDLSAFAALEEEWQALAEQCDWPEFYRTALWCKLVLQETPDSFGQPLVLAVRCNGQLSAVFPLAISVRKRFYLKWRVLHWLENLYAPRGGALVLAQAAASCGAAVADYCLRGLAGEWDLCELRGVEDNDYGASSFLQSLGGESAPLTSSSYESVVVDVARAGGPLALFESRSKAFRQNLRTAMNRLARHGGFSVRMVTAEREELNEAERQYYEVLRQSWKAPEHYPNFHRRLMQETAACGKLRLFLLYTGVAGEATGASAAQLLSMGIPVLGGALEGQSASAAALFVVEGKTAHYLKTVYTAEAKSLSAGALLTWAAFWQLLVREGIQRVDFQRGLDSYKFLWSDQLRRHMTYLVANPASIRGRAWAALWGAYRRPRIQR